MPGRWSWLLEEVGLRKLIFSPLVYRYIMGELRGASDLVKCALCPNMCRHACPVSIVDGRETTSPSGKARLGMLVERGYVDLDRDVAEAIYACLSCEACRKWCYFSFSVDELLRPLRGRSIEEGKAPRGVQALLSNLSEHGYPYGEPRSQARPSGGGVVYFPGCVTTEHLPELAESALRLLELLGFNAQPLEGVCCGAPAYYAGDERLFKRLAARLAEVLESAEPRLVVASCPSCVHALRNLYPSLGVRVPPRVLHVAELLAEQQQFPGRVTGLRVTYHDPCKLVYALGKPNLLRELLARLGVSVVDPRRRGDETFCCGYGGTLPFSHRELADSIARERLSELKEAAKTVVTACPACKLAFTRNGGRVLDITELAVSLLGGERGG